MNRKIKLGILRIWSFLQVVNLKLLGGLLALGLLDFGHSQDQEALGIARPAWAQGFVVFGRIWQYP